MIPSILKAVTDTPALLADIQANPLDPAVFGKLAEAVRRNDEAAGILLRALAESSGLLPLTRDGVDNRIRIETSESLLRGKPRDVQSNAPLILWNGWPRGVEFEALDQFRMGVHGAFSRWPLQHLGIDFSSCEVDDLKMLDAEFIRLGELKRVTSLSFVLPPDKVLNTDAGFLMFVKVCKELFRDSWHLTNLQRLCMVNPVGNIFGVDRILDALQGPKLLKQLRAGWFQIRGDAPGIDTFFTPTVLPLCTDLTFVGCDVPVRKYGQTAPVERSVVDVYAGLPIVKQITRLRFIGCDVNAGRLANIQKAAGVSGLERLSIFANREQLDVSGVTRNIFGKLRHLAVVGTPIANAQALQSGGLVAGLESLELSQCGRPLRYWRGDLQGQQQWCKEGRESVVALLKLCEKHPQKKHHYPLKALNLSGCGAAMPQIADALVANRSLGNLLLLGLDGLHLNDVGRLTSVVKNRTLDCVRALTALLDYDDEGETPNLDGKLQEALDDHLSLTWARFFDEPFVGDMGFEPFYAGTWFGNQCPPPRWFAGSDLP